MDTIEDLKYLLEQAAIEGRYEDALDLSDELAKALDVESKEKNVKTTKR